MLLMKDSINGWKINTDEENKKKSEAQKKNTKVLQIFFNSWQFEDYEDTKLTLIETILRDVIKDIDEIPDDDRFKTSKPNVLLKFFIAISPTSVFIELPFLN